MYEFLNLISGAYAPVYGFMDEKEVKSVLETDRLPSGDLFTLPIMLPNNSRISSSHKLGEIDLIFRDILVGRIRNVSTYTIDKKYLMKLTYGTLDEKHPGVSQTMQNSSDYISGDIESFLDSNTWKVLNYFHPQESKAIFKARGWKTIAGFQTRNVPHLAHEYIQRVCMELLDGLFIQPILGHKKVGDFTQEAVSYAYKNLMDRYYPNDKVLYSGLYTFMRYAGPKEAILHSILRRNYGCTHFVIGRDHAGVGNYYGAYEAQSLAKSYESELNINILTFSEPVYCTVCKSIVTKNNCKHTSNPELITKISGTQLREILTHQRGDSSKLFREDLLAGFDVRKLLIE